MKQTISRTGETSTANNGQIMTIITYRKENDIDIQFEDGTIVKNRSYNKFKKGSIRNPNCDTVKNTNQSENRIGETAMANNGQTMTIIAYRTANDLDVKFEDNTIVKNRSYNKFKKGSIRNPNCDTVKNTNQSENRIGEIITAKNGLKMAVIAYRTTDDIDILFEDGTIKRNKTYTEFKKGGIGHPNIKSYGGLNVKGHLYNTLIIKNGFFYKTRAYYMCHCPICNEQNIWTFEQIKTHACNLDHPDQKLLENLKNSVFDKDESERKLI